MITFGRKTYTVCGRFAANSLLNNFKTNAYFTDENVTTHNIFQILIHIKRA